MASCVLNAGFSKMAYSGDGSPRLGGGMFQRLLPPFFPPKSENAGLSGKGGIWRLDDAFARAKPPSNERKLRRGCKV